MHYQPDNPKTAARHALEFTEGFMREGATALREARNVVGWARRMLDEDERAAQSDRNAEFVEYARRNPMKIASEVVRSVREPIEAELDAGRPAAAAGRGAVLLAGLVLPVVGVEKLARFAATSTEDSEVVEGTEATP